MNVLLWLGPVEARNLGGVRLPPGWRLVTVNRGEGGGITSSAFRAACAGGVDELLRGKAPATRESLALAGWSAGGAGVDELLSRGAEDPRVLFVGIFDGYFNGADVPDEIKPGAYRYAQRAARGGGEMWVTTGHVGGSGYLSSAESFAPLATSIGVRAVATPDIGLDVVGAHAYGRGLCTWVDYPAGWQPSPSKEHTAHARLVAPAVLGTWFRGFGGRKGAGGLAVAVAALAALALGERR
ncbi:MAG: hypothetical protein IT382_00500 [Deltaproteobacteria bacterium]|nr:hypothetical protein [Deltaproteobacteria bacterium]